MPTSVGAGGPKTARSGDIAPRGVSSPSQIPINDPTWGYNPATGMYEPGRAGFTPATTQDFGGYQPGVPQVTQGTGTADPSLNMPVNQGWLRSDGGGGGSAGGVSPVSPPSGKPVGGVAAPGGSGGEVASFSGAFAGLQNAMTGPSSYQGVQGPLRTGHQSMGQRILPEDMMILAGLKRNVY